MTQTISNNVLRSRGLIQGLDFRNPVYAELVRDGNVIWKSKSFNGVTTEGKNHVLDTVFGAASPVTQIDPWYIGLINNSPAPTLAAGDTLASHAGWSEFTSYSGNRQAWTDADASAGAKAASAVSEFTMTAGGTIYGIFIAGAATGTASTLFSTAAFDTLSVVVNTDVLRVSFGLSL